MRTHYTKELQTGLWMNVCLNVHKSTFVIHLSSYHRFRKIDTETDSICIKNLTIIIMIFKIVNFKITKYRNVTQYQYQFRKPEHKSAWLRVSLEHILFLFLKLSMFDKHAS